MIVYETSFNITELGIIRHALEEHARRRGEGAGSEMREEVGFILGIAARVGGLLRNGTEAQLFCSKCYWYGCLPDYEPCPSCRVPDYLCDCRGGTPSETARKAAQKQKRSA